MKRHRHFGASLDVSPNYCGTDLRDVGLLRFNSVGHNGKKITWHNSRRVAKGGVEPRCGGKNSKRMNEAGVCMNHLLGGSGLVDEFACQIQVQRRISPLDGSTHE